ncbi:hypothetical protein, partial [Azospirillum endophyticum]|uniref:hypothetical protein n=1 Tax=Azospirillum endophyticum TaxID=2800326 RepID=UPI001B3C11B4
MAELTTELQALVDSPQESLNIEVKRWLDLGDKAGAATIAKAAIAPGLRSRVNSGLRTSKFLIRW